MKCDYKECRSSIDKKRDNWTEMISYKDNKEVARRTYHTRCFSEMLEPFKQQKVKEVFKQVKQFVDNGEI